MAEDLVDLRRRLAAGLADRIAAAVEGYESFVRTKPPEDAKGFAAWHAAARAALAHVDLLVKLARWAEGGATAGGEDGIEALLTRARAALAGLEDDEAGEDEA